MLNQNTQCNISPTQSQALIAVWSLVPGSIGGRARNGAAPNGTTTDTAPQVDRISGKITVNVSLEWRKCR